MDRNDYTKSGYLAARSLQAGQTVIGLAIAGWMVWSMYDFIAESVDLYRESRRDRKARKNQK